MPRRFLTYSRTQPARTILASITVVTFLAGLFIMTPWFYPVSEVAAAASLDWSRFAGGLLNTIVCIPGFLAIKRNTPKSLANGAFYLFIWYTFVTFTRIATQGVLTLTWVPVAIIAIVLSVVYIEQQFLARREPSVEL